MKPIAKGAEAVLYLDDSGRLVKERAKKEYRICELDVRLRRQRTKHEAKIMEKISGFGYPAPKVFEVDKKNARIVMEYVDGRLLKNVFEEDDEKSVAGIGESVGGLLKTLHGHNIIHNDLTTSNMIDKGDSIYIIDWGLGYHSTRLEDKAMDLVVFKKSLMATHPKKFKLIWDALLGGYKPTKELAARVEKILSRVRYH